MKNNLMCTFLITFLTISCEPYGIINYHGSCVFYGEGRHAGIDYSIRRGTPIIAASDGVISYVGT